MKKSNSKKQMNMKSLLKNRNVLYVVFFFALANLFSYLMLDKLDAVAFFIVSGFVTSYFSKNMIIVMLTAMFSTLFLVQIKMLGKNVNEGFTEKTEEADEEEPSEVEEEEEEEVEVEETDEEKIIKKKPIKNPKNSIERMTVTSGSPKGNASKTTNKKREQFTQQLNPAKYNPDEDDAPRHKPKVDYASTLEAAYDNLDKLLSSDSIRNMSEETNRLAEKQHKLMGNIKDITPIMDKASSMLNNLDIGGISGLMKGMQDRLAGFGEKAAEIKDTNKPILKKE